MNTSPLVPLAEIATLVRRPVEVHAGHVYPELGIRSFGRGTFHKPALTAAELGSKRLFRIRSGDLLFNIVFAWEGAVAIAGTEDDGRFASHRFLSFVVDGDRVLAPFLKSWFVTPNGLDVLRRASPGGAGRNRTLGIEAAKSMLVPLPPLDEQRRVVDLLDRAAGIRRLREAALAKARDTIPALFLSTFGDFRYPGVRFPISPLETVAEIRSGLTKGRKLNGKVTQETPYMRVANVQDGHLNLIEVKTIPATAADRLRFALVSVREHVESSESVVIGLG